MQQDAVGGPYMSKGDQWIGWDDVDYVSKKASPIQAHYVKMIIKNKKEIHIESSLGLSSMLSPSCYGHPFCDRQRTGL